MRLTSPRPHHETATAIVDNRARKVGQFLGSHLVPGSLLSVVSAYFTIYGYGDLRSALDHIERMRFLYGDPRGVGVLDPEEAEDKAFRLTDEGDPGADPGATAEATGPGVRRMDRSEGGHSDGQAE